MNKTDNQYTVTSLDPFRREIDRIDHQIIALLNARMEQCQRVGEVKQSQGAAVYVPSREEAIFKKLVQFNQGPLKEKDIRAIYREIFSSSTALQKVISVAYLGPSGTYTHQAALKSFGSQVAFQSARSINDVFDGVEKGNANYGVIPIENSSEGAVLDSMDRLVESPLKMVAQIHLDIQHALLSCGAIDSIKIVYSKDQALGQCRKWLQQHLPQAQCVPVASTTAAVLKVKNDPTAAAIAGELNGSIYGLPILETKIQDTTENITRFIVIAKAEKCVPPSQTCKTSLLLAISDQVGALEKALQCFSSRSINLTKIESRPSREKPWDYVFFVDLIGHIEEPSVKAAVEELGGQCKAVKWLGSYGV